MRKNGFEITLSKVKARRNEFFKLKRMFGVERSYRLARNKVKEGNVFISNPH